MEFTILSYLLVCIQLISVIIGVERLKDVILASHALPRGDIVQEILNAVRTFTRDHPQSDDITLMVIRSR